uniref:mannose-6-phosphate isomerase n=1 Tax=Plectus sambesii TaxID=2011161 RepID=A0A914UQT4_9BILA
MGTHPDGPAKLRGSGTKLSNHIATSKSDRDLNRKWSQCDTLIKEDIHLPFIMKIMSIRTTLSLQVHPTKKQAARLHRLDPINYPDSNHKPELALALTRFELLCGFRPAKEIADNLRAFPEFRIVFGERNARRFEEMMERNVNESSEEAKNCLAIGFRAMMEAPAALIAKQLLSLRRRLQCGEIGCLSNDTVKVLLKMQDDFPGDNGCFSPLYLNHMILEPGECCYYAAEEMHAYLSGECVECVGCSNNTIRAALTNKHKDLEILCETLNYRMTDPEHYMIRPNKFPNDNNIDVYDPEDCPDFALHQIKVDNSIIKQQNYTLPALGCGSIVVIVKGQAKVNDYGTIKRGDIFYIPPNEKTHMTITGDGPFVAYRTFSYEEGPDHSDATALRDIRTTAGNINFAGKLNAACKQDTLKLTGKLNMPKDVNVFDLGMEMDGFC